MSQSALHKLTLGRPRDQRPGQQSHRGISDQCTVISVNYIIASICLQAKQIFAWKPVGADEEVDYRAGRIHCITAVGRRHADSGFAAG